MLLILNAYLNLKNKMTKISQPFTNKCNLNIQNELLKSEHIVNIQLINTSLIILL